MEELIFMPLVLSSITCGQDISRGTGPAGAGEIIRNNRTKPDASDRKVSAERERQTVSRTAEELEQALQKLWEQSEMAYFNMVQSVWRSLW